MSVNEQLSTELMDEGLSRLARLSPEYGGAFSNHGPMVVEALARLGRAEQIESWVDGYLGHLKAAPPRVARISQESWMYALGDLARVTDWHDFFLQEIGDHGWTSVLRQWWPRLLIGVGAGATHGIIRTAHAVRSLRVQASEMRTNELAHALAYWAARFLQLPGRQESRGSLTPSEALGNLPSTTGPVRPGLIRDRLAGLPSVQGLGEAVEAIASPGADRDAALEDLLGLFAQVFVERGGAFPTAFVHSITAPAAVRAVIPLLDEAAQVRTYFAVWQLNAAVFVAHANGSAPVRSLSVSDRERDADWLIDEALANGDEHCLKLVEVAVNVGNKAHAGNLLIAARAGLRLFPE